MRERNEEHGVKLKEEFRLREMELGESKCEGQNALAYGSLDMHVHTVHTYPMGYVVNLRIMPTVRMYAYQNRCTTPG